MAACETQSVLVQVHAMLGGLAGRSAQHRDMLCRMAASSLAALATGSLQTEANQQLATRYGRIARKGRQWAVSS